MQVFRRGPCDFSCLCHPQSMRTSSRLFLLSGTWRTPNPRTMPQEDPEKATSGTMNDEEARGLVKKAAKHNAAVRALTILDQGINRRQYGFSSFADFVEEEEVKRLLGEIVSDERAAKIWILERMVHHRRKSSQWREFSSHELPDANCYGPSSCL